MTTHSTRSPERRMARFLGALALTAVLAGIITEAGIISSSGTATAKQPITRTDAAGGFPISAAVSVPAGSDVVYLSGMTPSVADPSAPKGSPQAYGDTATQTVSTLNKIKEALAAQKLTLGDVVMMHVYLVGDPAHDGKMDFAGMMSGYTQFFGTADQPNKPARTTVQVAGLAAPGLMVEIEVIAARAP
ncbi:MULTISPECIES: RidA family protein [Nitrospirillum]|uniref:Enamine deaminase RidA (YjgF/YER057c/UK114 family) n=1 Tax=Nitrospirillum amazonense TaxID=28077 RepID=A0A560FV15_9PROT|nr:RidA family protein [Nitrospirillum amazonense]MEC4593652.1 RidA family protein [Nitrospirillum amazonense]TWB25401.1 enamine deaminase RidA (YjgF/YER057c/UK114 family) [Nitrospirillum amazonense]